MSDGGIDPPAPPQAPVGPTSPAPGVAAFYGSDDPKVLVRSVLGALQKKQQVDLSSMPDDYLAKMEAALVQALTKDELARYGLEIRRILRFQQSTNARIIQGSAGQAFALKKPSDPGKKMGSLPIKRLGGAAAVEARTHVWIKTGWARDAGEAYTLELTGAKDCSWIQFMWRRIALKRGGSTTSLQLRVDHGGKAYLLTSNEKTPRWSTDALDPATPFYEKDSTVIRGLESLKLCDEPSPMESYVEPLLAGPDPPSEIRSLFRAATYLVRGREVFLVANTEMDWKIEKKGAKAASTLLRQDVKLKLVAELSAAHRAALARQYPKSDYFPGPPIEAPVPDDAFEAISATNPLLASWPAGQDEQKRYQAAAAVAVAQLIEDVSNTSPPIAAGRKTRGLNYDTSLKEQGQTGFLDAANTYHNPDIPLSRSDPLPRIAILLGKSAFEWTTSGPAPVTTERTKDYVVATLRHEMLHARHAKLAIGWLLRWRDQLTSQSFESWLDGERRAGKISEADYHLVRVALAKGTSPTEIFAWLEGFLAASAFLPASPKLSDVPAQKEKWPAAISELDGAFKYFNMSTLQGTFAPLVKARVVGYACGGLTKAERDVLAAWLNVFIDPAALSPSTADEKLLVANLRSEVGKNVALLKDIRKSILDCKS